MGKKKLATAIAYSSGDPSPRMLASGRGREAEQIIALARQAGVAVVEDKSFAILLDSWAGGTFVKSGDFIPPWCWEAAAKILAFVLVYDKESEQMGKVNRGK
jgi:flagellar biosynthesis protein